MSNTETGSEQLDSDAVFRAYLEGTSDSVCIRDRQLRLLLWNQSFANAVKANCGVDISAGMRAEDYVPAQLFAMFEQKRLILYRTFDGEPQQAEFAYPCPDGTTVHLDVRWSPVRIAGEVVAVAEVTRDVTQQKKLEIESARMTELLQGYLECGREGLWGVEIEPPMSLDLSIDEQIDYLYAHACIAIANDTYAHELGYDCWRNMVGMRLDEFMPRSDPKSSETLRQLAEAGYKVEQLISHETGKNGDKHVMDNTFASEIKEGCLIRAWGTHRDITSLIEIQEEARQQQNTLAHINRVASLEPLTGSIAHELNQPLGSILSNAQAARRFLNQEPVDLSLIREILDDIIQDVQRASEISRRMRRIIKKGERKQERIDANRVVQEALALLENDLKLNHITLDLELIEGLPEVRGDSVQFLQVLINLLLNASEAMLDLQEDQRRITIRSACTENGSVTVTIRDRGPGITPPGAAEIFEPFFTTKEEGLGMGLAISRTILGAHGGHLELEEHEGPGALFRITLPAASDSAS